MSLYIVRNGAPCVMVNKKYGRRIASFPIDHAMIFEEAECLMTTDEEYRFMSRDGKEYYFNACDVRTIK